MLELSVEGCLKKVPNNFMLTTLLSKRVRELRRGARPLIETKSKNFVEIAMEEIKQGKVEVKIEDAKPTL
jgi:DNA-directed RNA polymerase subunit omega